MATANFTPDEYEELKGCEPHEVDAAAKALADAPPELTAAERRALMQQALDEARSAREQQRRDALDDVTPPECLASPFARPVSGGVLRVLELVDHPLMQESPDVENLALGDVLVLGYVLCEPDLARVLGAAKDGSLQDAADLWAFELSPEELEEVATEAAKAVANAFAAKPQNPEGNAPRGSTG